MQRPPTLFKILEKVYLPERKYANYVKQNRLGHRDALGVSCILLTRHFHRISKQIYIARERNWFYYINNQSIAEEKHLLVVFHKKLYLYFHTQQQKLDRSRFSVAVA